jgi:hypothetical protein
MTAASVPAAATTVRQRMRQPGLVFVACYLLAGVAALRVVAAIAAFFAVPEFTWIYSERYGDDNRGQAMALGLVVLGVLSLFVAAIFLTLAILDGRGLNWARIITWVVGSLAVLGFAAVLAISVYDAVTWYQRLSWAVAWTSLGFVLVSLVLLTLPRAHEYYRSTKPPRVPPMPVMRPPPYGGPMVAVPVHPQPPRYPAPPPQALYPAPAPQALYPAPPPGPLYIAEPVTPPPHDTEGRR